MIRDIVLSIIVILGFSQPFVLRFLPEEIQYFYWETAHLLFLFAVSAIFFFEVRYSNFYRKFLSYLVMNIAGFGFMDYIVRVFVESNYNHNNLMIYALYFLASTCFFIAFALSYLKYFIKKTDKYCEGESFLVYSYPKSFSGLISTIITAPYGHCSLVVDGKKFYFKDGEIVERYFGLTDEFIFKKIPTVNIAEARKLLGKKWSLTNNCFRIFRRFK